MPKGIYVGNKGELNAARIKSILDSQLTPITNSSIVSMLQQYYGKTIKQWSTMIANHFNSVSHPQSILRKYTRKMLNGRFVIIVGEDKPEHGIGHGQAYALTPNQQTEHEMRAERIAWSQCGTTQVYNLDELTSVEHWLDHKEEGVTPYVSCWHMIEQSAWLYANSTKRPEDIYGRHGKRVKGSRFNRVNSR